jgi:hypothetical protein
VLREQTLVVRPGRRRWRRCRPTRDRARQIVENDALVTKQNRTMFAVARLHATAERDQIFVCIDHDALRRLRRPRIVDAFVESHPSSAIFLAATYLWPRQSATHCPVPSIPPCPRRTEAPALASHGVGFPTDERITGSRRRVKKGGVANEQHLFIWSGIGRPPVRRIDREFGADPRRKVPSSG